MDDFNFFLPIEKIDKEKRTISGYASTPATDTDGETVTLDAVKAALPEYMRWGNVREMHRSSAVGIAKEANIDQKGLYLTAKITDDTAWAKCLDTTYKGFSIGGKKLAKSGKQITKIDLIEISVVDRPANPECSFTVQKRAKDGGAAYLIKPRRPSVERALAKMAQAVETLVEERTELVEKREFSSKEREADASNKKALPDGSFPIENKSDLANARQAVGRAKDKSKARAHIKARAEALGVKLPDNWTKKSAKALMKATESPEPPGGAPAAKEKSEITSKSASLAVPAFLTLDAGDGVEAVWGEIGSSHELDLTGKNEAPSSFLSLEVGHSQHFDINDLKIAKRERKLLKRMSVAGQLAYCFDSIRDAQRSLISEGIAEGGDQKDKGLATKLGVVAEQLAAIIGQKASHEGEEARTLSDAGDRYLRSTMGNEELAMSATTGVTLEQLLKSIGAGNLAKRGPTRADHMNQAKAEMKKAKDSRKEAAKCIKSAHGLLKAHYLAKEALVKAGKKDEAEKEELDMGKVMSALQKAHGALEMNKTFVKAASESFAKAAGRIAGHGGEVEDPVPGVYQVPEGVKTLNLTELTEGAPGPFRLDGPDMARAAGFVSKSEAESLAKTAALEAENKILRAMPAGSGSSRPAAFDMSKMSSSNRPATGDIFEGIDPSAFQSPNEDTRNNAMSKAVGNFIMKTPGRSVMDPAFHGAAGARSA